MEVPGHAEVTPSSPVPLDRPPPPHRSLAMRPFRCDEVKSVWGGSEVRGLVTLKISQGVVVVGFLAAPDGDRQRPIPPKPLPSPSWLAGSHKSKINLLISHLRFADLIFPSPLAGE